MSGGDRNSRLRIVVAGLAGSLPLAGLTAHYLQYVLGSLELGHDVLYLEDTGWYYDPWSREYVDEWSEWSDRRSRGPRPPELLHRAFGDLGLGDRWTWVDIDGTAHGVTGHRLDEFLGSADVFLHVTGAGRMRDRYLDIPSRVYIDTDPGFVQARIARWQEPADLQMLADHNVHATFGTLIGRAGCRVPDVGVRWHPTVQPVHLPLWPALPPPPPGAPFTTVVKWQPYEVIEHEGVRYGMKDVEFLPYCGLPARASHPFELAMEGTPPLPEGELRRSGWRIVDSLPISRDLAAYRAYISRSFAEWSVAKQGYVAARTGWFSDRSAAYLASGRPVVLQSTGFEERIPTGEGLLTFATQDECLAAVEDVAGRYPLHTRRARELAVEYFDARRVLADLVDVALAARSVGSN